MSRLVNITDAQVGDTISFNYYGGSTPGKQRTVEVLEVLDDRIVAKDVHQNALRSFLSDKATCVQYEPPCQTVKQMPQTPSVAKVFLCDAITKIQQEIDDCDNEDIARMYELMTGYQTKYNEQSQCLEVEVGAEGSMLLADTNVWCFTNQNLENKYLDVCEGDFFFGDYNDENPTRMDNPVQFCRALAQHLGLEIQDKS